MTTKPTKGPFRVIRHTMDRMVCHVAGKNIGGPVATFHGENCEANARLFVHAAELVEAARAVVDSGRELRFQEAWNDIDEDEGADFEADLSDLRAIIAEIEGEKS